MKLQLSISFVLLIAYNTTVAAEDDCQESASTDRYDMNENGTVTEIETGLTWMRCSLGQEWNGSTCNGSAKAMSWQEASDYVAQLNEKGGFASFTNWRVPNLNELATISELRCGPPRINGLVFPNTAADVFWSNNSTPGDARSAYTFSFGNAGVDSGPKSAAYFIRLVRGRD